MTGYAARLGGRDGVLTPQALERALWLAASLASIAVAYAWRYEFGPQVNGEYVGTYVAGPTLWLVAGTVSWLAWRRQPALPEERPIVGLAALIGLFGVAAIVLAGVYAGMGVSPYAHAPAWLATNFAFAFAPLVALECFRAFVLRLFAGRTALGIGVTAVALTALSFPYRQLLTREPEVNFVGGRLLPELASNILASFLAMIGGPMASVAYRGAFAAYEWYSPYLSNLPWLTAAFIGVATPAVSLWIAESLLEGEAEGHAEAEGTRAASRLPSTTWVITCLASLGMLWFSLGFFGVQPSVVPTASMEPTVRAGSLAITRDVDAKDVRLGDVILYRRGRTPVLHRVIIVWPNGTFTTKGDNNNTADPELVFPQQIEGRLLFDVPHAGWPGIWLSRGVRALRGG